MNEAITSTHAKAHLVQTTLRELTAFFNFHPFEALGPKRLALLESSRAHLFREEVLHQLPAEKLFSFPLPHLKGRVENKSP